MSILDDFQKKLDEAYPPDKRLVAIEANQLGIDYLKTHVPAERVQESPQFGPLLNYLNGTPIFHDKELDANQVPVVVMNFASGRRKKLIFGGHR